MTANHGASSLQPVTHPAHGPPPTAGSGDPHAAVATKQPDSWV